MCECMLTYYIINHIVQYDEYTTFDLIITINQVELTMVALLMLASELRSCEREYKAMKYYKISSIGISGNLAHCVCK